MLLQLLSVAATQCFAAASELQGNIQKMSLTLTLQPSAHQDQICYGFSGKDSQGFLLLPAALTHVQQRIASDVVIYDNNTQIAFTFNLSTYTEADFLEVARQSTLSFAVQIGSLQEMTGGVTRITHVINDVSACWGQLDMQYALASHLLQLEVVPLFCQFASTVRAFVRYSYKGAFYTLPDFIGSTEPGQFNTNYDHLATRLFVSACSQYTVEAEKQQCVLFYERLAVNLDMQVYLVLQYVINGVDLETAGQIQNHHSRNSRACMVAANPDMDLFEDRIIMSVAQFKEIPDCIIAEFDYVRFQAYVYSEEQEEQEYSVTYERQLTPTEYLNNIAFDIMGNFSSIFGAELYVRVRFLCVLDGVINRNVIYQQKLRKFCIHQMHAFVNTDTIDLYLHYYPYGEMCKLKETNLSTGLSLYYYGELGIMELISKTKVYLPIDQSTQCIQSIRLDMRDLEYSNNQTYESVMLTLKKQSIRDNVYIDIYNSKFFIDTTYVHFNGQVTFVIMLVVVFTVFLSFTLLISLCLHQQKKKLTAQGV